MRKDISNTVSSLCSAVSEAAAAAEAVARVARLEIEAYERQRIMEIEHDMALLQASLPPVPTPEKA